MRAGHGAGGRRLSPGPLLDQLQKLTLSPRVFVALVTRGYAIDVEALPTLLRSPVAYIGVIGSRRRWATAVSALREAGVSGSELARVRAPIGLEIQAETPEEIAVEHHGRHHRHPPGGRYSFRYAAGAGAGGRIAGTPSYSRSRG